MKEGHNKTNEAKETKRWQVLLGGVLMQLCIGGIYTWSLFNQPLVDA